MAAKETQASPSLVLSDEDVERRKALVGLEADDVSRIVAVGKLIAPRIGEITEDFFRFLSEQPEAAMLFRRRDQLEEAKRLKRDHLGAMAAGEYGKAYADQRVRLGLIYGRAGIDVRVFLGAFNRMMRSIAMLIAERFKHDPDQAFEYFTSFERIAFFDIGIIVDVLIDARERTIALQQSAILELSTPVLQVRQSLLILPIIGIIDSQRAKQLTDTLLRAIRTNRAKVVVVDITGVAAVDSRVANHLIQTVAASRLMGAQVIVTGLSADVAQSIVTLGIDMAALNTVGDLQGGLEEAERMLGYAMVALSPAT